MPTSDPNDHRVRAARPEDVEAVVDVAVRAGLFDDSARDFLRGTLSDEPPVLLVADEDGIVGAAYAAPVEATDRTWDLIMLAVDPTARRGGLGRALVQAVESAAREAGGRLLVVHTSGTDDQAAARALYRATGFTEEARVRDFWSDGEDDVVFRLRLVPA